ncbi:MAG: metallophosphoesterase family protein [Thermoguttaceae bacterium]
MPPRTIAIGDIHGCSAAFAAILAAIDIQPDDTLITLGDYVDRGIDSKGVLDQLIELESRCHLIPLMGNHEEMMLGARGGKSDFNFWMACGGIATLDSYGSTGQLRLIRRDHFAFLERLRPYHETETHFFVHANYAPNLPLDKQSSEMLFWRPLTIPPGPHFSGKVAIVGHTPQKTRAIWDLGYAKCIDTGCGHGGLLTALDIGSGQIWQVDEEGDTCVA